MSKNNKEKSSFWKKFGLGKNKTSASSMTSEAEFADKNSIKSKRLSVLLQPSQQPSVPVQKIEPPLPTKTVIKETRVSLPKALSQESIHVDNNNDISCEPITTPIVHQEEKESKLVYTTEQPNVTPTRNSDSSSFVVVKSNDEIITSPDTNTELLEIISELKLQLENEKATVNVLQLQKQAVTKDLDYFELSVDELLTEKADLLQQLEDEKIKNQRYLDDLNLSLEKQKATADNARGQSFAVNQTKLEFESIQEQWRQDEKNYLSEISCNEKTIRDLKSKLTKSQDQVDTLNSTIEQLIKSHTEELSRLAAVEKEKNAWPLHTPNGSPRIQPNEIEDWSSQQPSPIVPIPSTSTPFQPISKIESIEYNNDIDDQLMKLTKEKEKLQSIYSKIPLSGGGPQSRRRREEVEGMLDQVDSQLSKVKQKIRRS